MKRRCVFPFPPQLHLVLFQLLHRWWSRALGKPTKEAKKTSDIVKQQGRISVAKGVHVKNTASCPQAPTSL